MEQLDLLPDLHHTGPRPTLTSCMAEIYAALEHDLREHDLWDDEDIRDGSAVYGTIRTGILFSQDGYNIAKDLESTGVGPDAAMVAMLDNMWSTATHIHNAAVIAWAKTQQHIPAQFTVDDLVVAPLGKRGRISTVRTDDRTYGIVLDSKPDSTYIFPWESIRGWTEERQKS